MIGASRQWSEVEKLDKESGWEYGFWIGWFEYDSAFIGQLCANLDEAALQGLHGPKMSKYQDKRLKIPQLI